MSLTIALPYALSGQNGGKELSKGVLEALRFLEDGETEGLTHGPRS